MRSKARKWGNSLGVLLPKSITDELSVVDGTQLEIDCDGDQITIKKVKKTTYKLTELLRDYPKPAKGSEVAWGPKRGHEEW
jgi:antitoxin MazE